MRYILLSFLLYLPLLHVSHATDVDCTVGPTAWCSSIDAAKECGAMRHCIQTIWSKNQLFSNGKKSSICSSCEDIVEKIRKALEKPQSEKEIKEILLELCSVIPIALMKDECSSIVGKNVDEVIEIILANIAPSVICRLIHVCPKNDEKLTKHIVQLKKVPVLPKMLNPIKSQKSEDVCQFCQWSMNKVKSFINDVKTEKELEDNLQQLCNYCPKTDECKSSIHRHISEIFLELKKDFSDTKKLCSFMSMCPKVASSSSSVSKQPIVKSSYGNLECDFCQFVISQISSILNSTNSSEAVLHYIEKEVCPFTKDVQQCKNEIEFYGKTIIKYIESGLDPLQICQKLKICKTGSMSIEAINVHQLPEKKTNGILCPFCVLAVTEMQDLLAKNLTDQEILNAIKLDLCNRLPIKEGKECNITVDTYGEKIITFLVNGTTPQKVCQDLRMCSSYIKTIIPIKKTVKSSSDCFMCKMMVNQVKIAMESNKTMEDEIKFVQENLCIHLGKAEKACNDSIRKYAPEISKLIENKMNATEICEILKMCEPKEEIKKEIKLKPIINSFKTTDQVNGEGCAICEFVMKEAAQYISANSSEIEIKKVLDFVCSQMPSTISNECKAFVDEYEESIATLISMEIDPKKICTFLDLCSKKTSVHQREKIVLEKTSISGPFCGFCKLAVDLINKELMENKTEHEIIEALTNLCDLLPKADQSTCVSYIDEYAPYVLQLVTQMDDPEKICETINLCGASSTNQHYIDAIKSMPLSVKSCGHGPKFWCKSEQSAKLCDSQSFCKKFYGN
ncbi:hypothetical protein SNEBB_005919 [Seison nebaliae]|nr:hypothetical protein SNEBB_005919 [Seison nebaliae]